MPISIYNVPWNRRMQTLAVASFVFTLPVICVCLWTSFLVVLAFPLNILFIPYLIYIFHFDDSHHTGARTSFWFRSLSWWKNFKDYFPIKLIKTELLLCDRKYIFGYHPHGVISYGALCSFGTDGCEFSKEFPGIDVHLVTLKMNFFIPFLREIWLSLGICSADRETFQSVLSKDGRAIALVVGGAAESLKAAPGTIDLCLAKRKGFVRQALLYEASLVPVLAFGENDVYDVARFEWAESLQERMQKALGFAIPFFHGRGIFNYDFGLLPHRRPITVVVGKPLTLPTVSGDGRKLRELGEGWLTKDPEGTALVDHWHGAYLAAVQSLYDEHKETYFFKRVKSMKIQ